MAPYPRFDKLEPERRAAIFEAALEEFIAHGFEDASLNQILEGAGISKGSFYYYFENKADLFVALISRYFDAQEMVESSGLLEASDVATFWEATERAIEYGVAMMHERPEVVRLGQIIQRLPESTRQSEAVTSLFTEAAQIRGQIFAHGQAVGAMRRDLPLPVMIELWGAVDAILDRWMFQEWELASSDRRDELMELSLDMFKRIFAP